MPVEAVTRQRFRLLRGAKMIATIALAPPTLAQSAPAHSNPEATIPETELVPRADVAPLGKIAERRLRQRSIAPAWSIGGDAADTTFLLRLTLAATH